MLVDDHDCGRGEGAGEMDGLDGRSVASAVGEEALAMPVLILGAPTLVNGELVGTLYPGKKSSHAKRGANLHINLCVSCVVLRRK